MIAAAEPPNSLPEIAFGDFVAKRSNGAQADAGLTNALTACLSAGVEVVSVLPEWVELRVPCDLSVISPLQELVTQLEAGLSPEVAEAISCAFHEMLCNAVEYGGHLDPAALVEVRLMRLKHAFICRIKDPGDGFDPSSLDHAAINNPNDNPVRHAFLREQKGLRGGGFGILLASQIVDDLVYNERHNEVLFIKYPS
ncbi:MAG TPA: ATP-binding protein [Pyrinomonadaceae bacterium]|jgi:anti-sigma regulatory factor (Ser/Thr protein kinase)